MLTRKSILIIDDEIGIVELLNAKLESAYKVVKAYDGLDGLEKAKSHTPDLILLDVKMPKLGGFEVLKKLKADINTRNIPVIMLTAEAHTNSILMAQENRVADYLIKPVELDVLVPLVKKHV